MSETHEIRIKRLRLRSWRRGIKEMDLLLGHFADTRLEGLDAGELDLFELVLEQHDQDLYRWVSGLETPPDAIAPMLARITAAASDRIA
ncbi:succinate dehydrogenase assembly factor 2 [Profundibacterium mesophilum]|uniref:FAD assembly factor SdhE n=1 Tax=Profundibacterium mesophilum KAUST100406-0324 TaxID=1037889 RepID=A0A921TE46_9RHOB|nr:succinate dehydrogenase assembly factor 2 [Profundibacterium mesophilum]KAF0676981.1 Flavinator of succinate dehydrogenase domain containing protein [Profundibacterium mesophilum KAUST100406-0324]